MQASIANASRPAFDSRLFRDVTGHFATGVAVVTTVGENGAPVGLVVNSFTSLSLDPPMVMWGIGYKTPSFAAFDRHIGFAVNIMGAAAKAQTLRFAKPASDKFADIAWSEGIHGLPVLGDALATLECRTVQRLPGGDHVIMIGAVERCDAQGGEPLLFHRGQFAELGKIL